MNDEDQSVAWSIDNPTVYNKVVTTALNYTPVILAHHCPYKTLPDGRLYVSTFSFVYILSVHPHSCSKGPQQTPKWKTLQKLIMSYFHNVMRLLTQLSDTELLVMALTETTKLVPYVTSSRKSIKIYLKVHP